MLERLLVVVHLERQFLRHAVRSAPPAAAQPLRRPAEAEPPKVVVPAVGRPTTRSRFTERGRRGEVTPSSFLIEASMTEARRGTQGGGDRGARRRGRRERVAAPLTRRLSSPLTLSRPSAAAKIYL